MERRTLYTIWAVLIFACVYSSCFPEQGGCDDRGVRVLRSPSDSRRRIALVIGNSGYSYLPLKHAANDARAIAAALRRLNFNVQERTDLGYLALNEAVEEFGRELRKGGVTLFYYSGHGIQVNGSNYLIPVDKDIVHESEVRYKAVDAGIVLAKMEQARSEVNIVILDACRDNPFSGSFRSPSRGLATMDAPNGTLIAYATGPGKIAADGTGDHGLFTSELVEVIETPGIKVEDVFKRVTREVREKSRNRQIPWISSSLEGDFWFVAKQAAAGDDAALKKRFIR